MLMMGWSRRMEAPSHFSSHSCSSINLIVSFLLLDGMTALYSERTLRIFVTRRSSDLPVEMLCEILSYVSPTEAMPVCYLWRDRQRKEYINRVASMSTDSGAFLEECYDDYLQNWC